ncbi:MAG: type II toxin-antitoxin system Phd/YefM family antitoxin [Actinomycetota bacterium]
MKDISATEAARTFSDVLDEVEGRRQSFLVVRHGKPIARITPVDQPNGRAVKEFFRTQHVDADFGRDVRSLRKIVKQDPPPKWDE